jgi:hypothetical protein
LTRPTCLRLHARATVSGPPLADTLSISTVATNPVATQTEYIA